MQKRALVTGVLGQDGSYLVEQLAREGYQIFGIDKGDPLNNPAHRPSYWNQIKSLYEHTALDMSQSEALESYIATVKPDEVYHLAAASFVSYATSDERMLLDANILPTHMLLSALKNHVPHAHLVFAASAEVFGESAQANAAGPFQPSSLYGISKHCGMQIVQYYRRQHNFRASNAILFNHESPRRGMRFVTRKITSTVAQIKLGLAQKLVLGNTSAVRDWGYAPDYVAAMRAMALQPQGADYVLATGRFHTVQELVECSFAAVGLDWRSHLETSAEHFRPSTQPPLADCSLAVSQLNFNHTRSFAEWIGDMVESDLAFFKEQRSH